ncbi:extracellular solute-binding protein [Vibrio nigripulchritudo]|uniref:extracellular solute-binding protein n=1 Tax=Vibrio nigripulchritudo TaxID=28173 RepID=UPI0003B20E2F|nr:extracellular solute-binding protein [Vibrio nigripulchritudo]CCN86020.1 Spermidine/putrescine transport system substrate-binding protein [Vibrio nigripulchritudo BLFn1]CCN97818.1 Spermidine/putrescine transport system substrate-binding protein [Vibrio nigripulchritudo ENn2]CCO56129.1 Spermidine/putrescine transport system substrate-binding protein [Vibrio nigripulchritudo Wn13]
MNSFKRYIGLALISALPVFSAAAANLEGRELYSGEQAQYDKALEEGMVVSFDTGPTWANWGTMFKRFKQRYPGMEIVYNDLGSAATVVALEKAKHRPQADTAYYFGASAIDAANQRLLTGFTPTNFEQIPNVFKHPDGEWFTIHTLNVAFLVNKKLVKTVPRSWEDLLKSEYKNSIVYQDPRTTGQGQVVALAANYARRGDMNNVEPGAKFLGELHKQGNVLRVVGTTPYAQFIKGEIPIWIGYENDGLKAMVQDGMGDDVAVVIPKEVSLAAPYAISKVKNGPNPESAKLWLNYVMSSEGQSTFAEGFVRPVLTQLAMPPSVKGKLVHAPQIKPMDLKAAAAIKPLLDKLWAEHALTH